MQIPDGFIDVPPRKLATIVTNLQMHERPQLRPAGDDGAWALVHRPHPEPDWYRALFRLIGEPYLWASRLRMSDEELIAILHDPDVELFTLDVDGRNAGMLELDFRTRGECELAFFGVTDDLVGTRAARWLMNQAIERAWYRPIERLWVHTCTLDHPKAVSFYLRSGFVPFKYQIEVLADPRIDGLLRADAAPGIPLIV